MKRAKCTGLNTTHTIFLDWSTKVLNSPVSEIIVYGGRDGDVKYAVIINQNFDASFTIPL